MTTSESPLLYVFDLFFLVKFLMVAPAVVTRWEAQTVQEPAHSPTLYPIGTGYTANPALQFKSLTERTETHPFVRQNQSTTALMLKTWAPQYNIVYNPDMWRDEQVSGPLHLLVTRFEGEGVDV
ncbi:hypothetical protein BDV23DRAFT_163892 [Aspergillus alliaceus]|uniref:Uncharacterized protein n=1 Tax=Petromyces alliaceus TaxID=209559 RepID=A0A5N7BW72_PETAA|nr:hypothetical protein BDV23DRAFT_163892 [Aspergillus alliaceus]